MSFRIFTFFLCSIIFFLHSCRQSYTANQTNALTYRISADTLSLIDSGMYFLIRPYKQQMDSQMSVPVIFCEEELKKELPAGTLNNMFCDVLFRFAKRNYSYEPMVCVMNYGGIRLPSFPKGTISVGKVYELMPFENELVIAEVKGNVLLMLADKIAANGGEPLAGMNLLIQGGKVRTLFVNGQEVDQSKVYYVLLSDYMANGGDGYGFLAQSGCKIVSLGVKVRDALIDEFGVMHRRGETLKAVSDGRIRKD